MRRQQKERSYQSSCAAFLSAGPAKRTSVSDRLKSVRWGHTIGVCSLNFQPLTLKWSVQLSRHSPRTSVSHRLKRMRSGHTSASLLYIAYVTTGTCAAKVRMSSACGSARAHAPALLINREKQSHSGCCNFQAGHA